MEEIIILKYLILNKELYIKYHKFLNKDLIKNLYKELYRILLVVESWYEKEDNNAFLNIQDFQAFFHTQYPALKKADMAFYVTIFDKMDKLDISNAILEEVLEAHRKRAIAATVADLAWGIANGQREFLELPAALQGLSEEHYKIVEPQIEFVTDDLEELYNTTYGRPGLKWRLKTLRKMMGSLRKGDFGFIFARPEAGKTTFIADQCGYMVSLPGDEIGPLLHFNNEEFGNKVKLRYYQATLGATNKELFSDLAESGRRYLDITRGRIRLVDRAQLFKAEIEDICKRVQPGLIVLDSIDKIEGFEDDRDDLKYKKIYQWSRELSKCYGPVIGVCHSSASGEGKKYLEMDDVAYAKTAKQGEADWILGIGRSHDGVDEKRRFLHLCKNKLIGDEEMDEDLRHGKLPVKLYADIAQYDDELDFE